MGLFSKGGKVTVTSGGTDNPGTEGKTGTVVEAGDDATNAQWWPLSDLPPLAFDHADIIAAMEI